MLPAVAQVLLLVLTSLLSTAHAETHPGGGFHEYCIIGAGPGGLQLAYFLERANRDYVIFEKSNTSGKDRNFVKRSFNSILGEIVFL